jgi:hypothetical protein
MSTIKADTLSTLDGTKSVTTDRVAQGTAAAWVNFNGTGTVAIRASYNVSSITDNGTGAYTVNFTTALADANYTAVGSADRTTGARQCVVTIGNGIAVMTTTSVGVNTLNDGTTLRDSDYVGVAIFR